MKAISISITLLLLSFVYANAQDCKFEINEVDNFNHTKTIESVSKQISLKTGLVSGESIFGKDVKISVANISNNYFIHLSLKYETASAFFLSSTKNALIILENDSIVPIIGVFEGFSGGLKGTSFIQKYTFKVSYETMLLLGQYNIKEIRIVDMDLNQKVDIKPAKGKEGLVKEMIQCIQKAILEPKKD